MVRSMLARRVLAACAWSIAACTRHAIAPEPLHNRSAEQPLPFTIIADGVGPIRAGSPADLAELTALFPGYRVVRDDQETVPIFVISDAHGPVMRVVADDGGTVSSVTVLSPTIVEVEHGWRVGAPLDGRAITDCMCAGEERSTLCWAVGGHVMVGIDLDCTDVVGDDMARQEEQRTHVRYLNLRPIEGGKITDLAWQPEPLQALEPDF